MVSQSALEKLSNSTINLSFEETSSKQYQKIQQYHNVTSYSTLDVLHQCARKVQLIKTRAAGGGSGANNVDFAFGHAVGAGWQAYLASNGDMEAAIFNAFLAWRVPYEAAIINKGKTITHAILAVQKFAEFWEQQLGDWQVWVLPGGKPAIELSISIDFENGYKHYCHIDAVLEHRLTKKLAILEGKTSGFKVVDEALYANSEQALSYAVLIDMLRADTNYEVFYPVYSTTSREWELFPFKKSTALKAEWILDAKLDHSMLRTYREINFYPKRGAACFAFMRRCEFFGSCNMTEHLPEMKTLPPGEEAERVDYAFKISDIVANQANRNQTPLEQTHGNTIENID